MRVTTLAVVLLAFATGCAEQKATPRRAVTVDMTLPDRGATEGPQVLWIDIVQQEGSVQYRVRDTMVSEERLRRQIERLTSYSSKVPIVVDRLEGVGKSELNHLASILKEAGAANISRRGKDNQAIPLN
jgi:hypothetical protein